MSSDWLRLLAEPLIIRALIVLLGAIVILLSIRLMQRSITTRVEVDAARYRIRKLTGLLGYLLVILLASMVFKDQLGHIAVAFGVIGAGVAVALQEVIASFGGWIAIALGGYYQVGDRILVNGMLGDVVDIRTLRTTLMECGGWVNADLYSGRIVHIPNSVALGDPIYNYTTEFRFLWDELVLPVKYGSDLPWVRSMLERVAKDVLEEEIDKAREAWARTRRRFLLDEESVTPMVTMTANDNWVEFTLRYVVDYKQRRQVKDQMFRRILEEISTATDRAQVASTTLQLIDPSPFDVRLESNGMMLQP
jgi:small-conductance mechanosensitive channel